MKPTVLLFNFTDKARVMKMKQAALPIGFRLRTLKRPRLNGSALQTEKQAKQSELQKFPPLYSRRLCVMSILRSA